MARKIQLSEGLPLSLIIALIFFSLLIFTFLADFLYQSYISNNLDMEFSSKIERLQKVYPLDEEDEMGGPYAKAVNSYLEFHMLMQEIQPLLFILGILSGTYYIWKHKHLKIKKMSS